MDNTSVMTSIIISSGSEENENKETVSDMDKLEMEIEDDLDLANSKITLTAEYYQQYLPKSHIKIKKQSTINVNGRSQVFTYEETINDSVLKAASMTLENAINDQRIWTPEEITAELIKEEPFCWHDERVVNRRVMSAWNALNKNYKESVKESKKTGNGVLDTRGLLHNPQMDDWMSRVEIIHMMLDGLKTSVGAKKNEVGAKKNEVGAKRNEVGAKKNEVGAKRNSKIASATGSQKQCRKNTKTRNLLQQSLYSKSVFYNSSPSDSDVNKNPVAKRKRRGITKAKDDDQLGDSMSTVMKAVHQSNNFVAQELALKEDQINARVNLGASGSGLKHSGPSVDRRLSNLEAKMELLHLKMDELKLGHRGATDRRTIG